MIVLPYGILLFFWHAYIFIFWEVVVLVSLSKKGGSCFI